MIDLEKLEIKPVSMPERVRINDIAQIELNQVTGGMRITNSFAALYEWTKAGLGLTDDQIGVQYSDDDIKEIGAFVKNKVGNPKRD